MAGAGGQRVAPMGLKAGLGSPRSAHSPLRCQEPQTFLLRPNSLSSGHLYSLCSSQTSLATWATADLGLVPPQGLPSALGMARPCASNTARWHCCEMARSWSPTANEHRSPRSPREAGG